MPECTNQDLISGLLVPDNFTVIFPDIVDGVGSNVQTVQIPELSAGSTEVPTPTGARLKVAGDSITYSSFTITFALDQNLVIYDLFLSWIKATCSPEDLSQFENFVKKYLTFERKDELALYRDLTVISNSGTIPMAWSFYGAFPISMSGIEFSSTLTDASMATIDVTFDYTYFDLSISGRSFTTDL